MQGSPEMVKPDFNFGFPKFKNNLRFNFWRLARVRKMKKPKTAGSSWTQDVTRHPGRFLNVLSTSFYVLRAGEMLLYNQSDGKTFLIINLQQNSWSILYFTIGVYVTHKKGFFLCFQILATLSNAVKRYMQRAHVSKIKKLSWGAKATVKRVEKVVACNMEWSV